MPPENRFLRRALLLLGAVAVLGFLGNRAGHLLARAGYFRAAEMKRAADDARHRRDNRPQRAVPPRRGDVVDAAHAKLQDIWRGSPHVASDWEAKARIDRILDGLAAEELAELFDRMEVVDGWQMSEISRRIGMRWAAIDPEAAMKAALAKSRNRGAYFASSIFKGWAAEHPQDALAFLDREGLDPKLLAMRDHLRMDIIEYLPERDFALAVEGLEKLENAAAGVLEGWGSRYVEDAAMREKLMEYAKGTGRPGDYAALNDGMVRQWPQDDVLGLMNHLQDLQAYLESDAVPAADRPQVDATAVGAAIYREYNEPALEWWMGRYADSAEAPQPVREAMSYWSRRKPDAAAQWLEQQPESQQRDALSAAAAPGFMAQNNFAQAAEIIDGIRDENLRRNSMDGMKKRWQMEDPEGAKMWGIMRGW